MNDCSSFVEGDRHFASIEFTNLMAQDDETVCAQHIANLQQRTNLDSHQLAALLTVFCDGVCDPNCGESLYELRSAGFWKAMRICKKAVCAGFSTYEEFADEIFQCWWEIRYLDEDWLNTLNKKEYRFTDRNLTGFLAFLRKDFWFFLCNNSTPYQYSGALQIMDLGQVPSPELDATAVDDTPHQYTDDEVRVIALAKHGYLSGEDLEIAAKLNYMTLGLSTESVASEVERISRILAAENQKRPRSSALEKAFYFFNDNHYKRKRIAHAQSYLTRITPPVEQLLGARESAVRCLTGELVDAFERIVGAASPNSRKRNSVPIVSRFNKIRAIVIELHELAFAGMLTEDDEDALQDLRAEVVAFGLEFATLSFLGPCKHLHDFLSTELPAEYADAALPLRNLFQFIDSTNWRCKFTHRRLSPRSKDMFLRVHQDVKSLATSIGASVPSRDSGCEAAAKLVDLLLELFATVKGLRAQGFGTDSRWQTVFDVYDAWDICQVARTDSRGTLSEWCTGLIQSAGNELVWRPGDSSTSLLISYLQHIPEPMIRLDSTRSFHVRKLVDLNQRILRRLVYQEIQKLPNRRRDK